MPDSQASSGPLLVYRQDLARKIIVEDAAQLLAVQELELIHQYLLQISPDSQSRWHKLKKTLGLSSVDVPQGLYIWGGVGRGKTYLMDLFFHSLPGPRKMRMHFHRFMLMVHRKLEAERGQSNPLVRVAQGIAKEIDVLCFDEFFVSDIGDAMILANLLEALFSLGVILVTTSNIVPDKLYEYGLQRQKFIPAITLIKQHAKVINVDGGIDYRLRSLNKAAVYHYPLTQENDLAMGMLYEKLTGAQHSEKDKMLDIQGRAVLAKRWSEGLVWFDFATLCGGPRGSADYIELAQQCHTVFLSDIPILYGNSDDKARRFITLIDEFYDHNVILVISAAVGLKDLYQGQDLSFPFARAQSRLLEMQTTEYLGKPHKPE
ncbi:MAG: cell division protein ZapE [Pseudomonadota bacterium]